jgi:hypothetical protein
MGYLNSAPREVLIAAARPDAGVNRPLAEVSVRDIEVPMLEFKPLAEPTGGAITN